MGYPHNYPSSEASGNSFSQVEPEDNSATPCFAYVGCYTSAALKGQGKGINVFSTDASTGQLTHLQLFSNFADSSFLVLDRYERYLYCVDEGQGKVGAFSLDSQTGQLTLLNTQSTEGIHPAALCIDPINRFLLVANYSSGSVSVLPINSDGTLAPVCDLVQMVGEAGLDEIEQAASHPHDLHFDSSGRYLLVTDKGFDKIFVFRFDDQQGKLVANEIPSVAVEPGAGPRHLAFHPNGSYIYAINELNSTVTTFSYDNIRGVLQPIQAISTLPADFTGKNTGAELKIAPSGKFLYGSNRGHDSIVVFEIDQLSGMLKPVQWESSGGKTPRYFNLDPAGRYLYACNQDSNTIVTFKVDQLTGRLSPTGQITEIGSLVCLIFSNQSAVNGLS
jgi:6-phosphogluconolactonase (cycloisomerase 2 family)